MRYTELDDFTLLEHCGDKDTQAQKALYTRYHSYAMGVCLRYCRSREEAQEVLNDAFFKVFTKSDSYSYRQSFKAWLRRILVNCAIDYYRRQKKHYNHLDVEDIREESEIPTALDALAEQEIYALIQTLPDHFRLTFNLFEIEGHSHEEVSKMLGISVGTSRSNLSRAKSKLRKLIKAQQHEKLVR